MWQKQIRAEKLQRRKSQSEKDETAVITDEDSDTTESVAAPVANVEGIDTHAPYSSTVAVQESDQGSTSDAILVDSESVLSRTSSQNSGKFNYIGGSDGMNKLLQSSRKNKGKEVDDAESLVG